MHITFLEIFTMKDSYRGKLCPTLERDPNFRHFILAFLKLSHSPSARNAIEPFYPVSRILATPRSRLSRKNDTFLEFQFWKNWNLRFLPLDSQNLRARFLSRVVICGSKFCNKFLRCWERDFHEIKSFEGCFLNIKLRDFRVGFIYLDKRLNGC